LRSKGQRSTSQQDQMHFSGTGMPINGDHLVEFLLIFYIHTDYDCWKRLVSWTAAPCVWTL